MTSKKNQTIFDIAIIGAGPVGIAFACGFAKSNMKIVLIEKQTKEKIENPRIDGREIALTHNSTKILKELGVWHHISTKSISTIREAKVLDGNSPYTLNFGHREIQKESLGYLIPNYLIRKNF